MKNKQINNNTSAINSSVSTQGQQNLTNTTGLQPINNGSHAVSLSKELPNIQTRPLVGGIQGQTTKDQIQQQLQNAQNTPQALGSLSAYLQNAKGHPKASNNSQIRHSSLRNHIKDIYMQNNTSGANQLIQLSNNNTNGAPREHSHDTSVMKKQQNSNHINGNGIKVVKPQELSLDLIMPSQMKNGKQMPSIGPQSTQNQNSNQIGSGNSVTQILQNMRTPQNNANQILQPLSHNTLQKAKDLQGLQIGNSAADSTLYHLNNQYNNLSGANQQKRLGKQRIIGSINPMINKPTTDLLINLNSPTNRISTSKERNSHIDVTPYKNKSVPHNLSISQNNKTPKESNSHHQNALSSIYNKKQSNHTLMKPEDRLNLSVEIVNSSKQNQINNKIIDNNLRLSRITEEKMNNSVDGISSRGNSVIHNINDSSQINGPSGFDDEKSKILKGNDGQQSNQATDFKPQNIQINLENLVKIEDKLTFLIENMRQQKFQQVSQLCSDWWEMTDEDEYSVSKFEKAFKEEKSKKEIKSMMVLEILAVAVANYFTNAPELIRPTHLQLSQVKNLLNYVHQNFLNAIDLILSKLPQEILENQFSVQLNNIIKTKKGKKSKKNESVLVVLRQNNENLINLLRNLVRQGGQQGQGSNAGMPFTSQLNQKKLQGKGINALKQQLLQGPPLKPLYSAINKSLKNIDTQSVALTRNIIIKASEDIEYLKQFVALPPLYGVGGTSIGGYEALPLVEAPYLQPVKDPKTYTLVLDLDETLVHYFEIGSEGNFLVRPGCDKFLKEMSEIYEVVIFTAAMQDYADWVLDQIDKEKHITYRLYRQHAFPYGHIFVKDLSRIGRDLSRTIIVDNVAENFQLQPDNGIFIKSCQKAGK
eukprot:403338002